MRTSFNAVNTIDITNSGGIGSAKTYVTNDGIYSKIEKNYSGQLGNSITGNNTVVNLAPIFSTGDNVYVATDIKDHKGSSGAAYAYSSWSNNQNLTSVNGDNLYERGNATTYGGHAVATVTASNSGVLITETGKSIDGRAIADAHYTVGSSSTVKGGNATATTSITNSGNLTTGLYQGNSTHNGSDAIHGNASANASADNYGSGNATGGTAKAGVTITNTAPKVTVNGYDHAINGNSSAYANATSDKSASGGTASATTTIYNSSNVTVLTNGNDTSSAAIRGRAKAYATANGNTSKGGSAIGGSATAAVTITNNKGNVTASDNHVGIYGYALANSNATGYTAQGGSASASVTISNNGNLVVEGGGCSTGDVWNHFSGGMVGVAIESAEAYGNTTASGGSATGGIAPATVSLSNAGNITAPFGFGQVGYANALAGAIGYTATGGTATATFYSTNSGALTTGKTDIFGVAVALSDAITFNNNTGSSATGGTATGNVSISNSGSAEELQHLARSLWNLWQFVCLGFGRHHRHPVVAGLRGKPRPHRIRCLYRDGRDRQCEHLHHQWWDADNQEPRLGSNLWRLEGVRGCQRQYKVLPGPPRREALRPQRRRSRTAATSTMRTAAASKATPGPIPTPMATRRTVGHPQRAPLSTTLAR